jgi:ribosomal protein S4E
MRLQFYKIVSINNNDTYPHKTEDNSFTTEGLFSIRHHFPRYFTLENAKEIISKLELDVEMPKTKIVRYIACSKKSGAVLMTGENMKECNDNYIVKKVEFEI